MFLKEANKNVYKKRKKLSTKHTYRCPKQQKKFPRKSTTFAKKAKTKK
jgi:hypothetical protein